MRKIYALLVGIDNYPNANRLVSCKKDVEKICQFLTTINTSKFVVDKKPLLDDKAKKIDIHREIIVHLGKAKEGDIALFYFSGHGCQEVAPKVFKEYDNSRDLESLVCYDFDSAKTEGLLSDKELRYLLANIAKKGCEVLTVIDSCHSGDMTKGGNLITKAIDSVNERAWNQFVFKDKFGKAEALTLEKYKQFFPNIKGIRLGACADKEVAYQDSQGSVFTTILLEILKQSDNSITYGELQRRLINRVRNRYNQHPVISYELANPNQLFMDGGIVNNGNISIVEWNVPRNSWQMDYGAIHGVDSSNIVTIVDKDSQDLTNATVLSIRVNNTILKIAEKEKLIQENKYYAKVIGLYKEPTNFYLNGVEEGIEAILKQKNSFEAELKNYNIQFVSEKPNADYLIIAYQNDQNSGYCLVPNIFIPDDFKFYGDRSLSVYLKFFSDSAVKNIYESLKSITKWKFLKNVESKASQINGMAVIKVCSEDEKPFDIKTQDNLKYIEIPPQKLLLKIVNTSSTQSIYAYLIYLSQDFEINFALTDKTFIEVKQNEEIFVPRAKIQIPVDVSTTAQKLTFLPYESLWLKLVYVLENENLNLLDFEQEGLLSSSTKGVEATTKSAFNPNEIYVNEWATDLIEIRLKNPNYIS